MMDETRKIRDELKKYPLQTEAYKKQVDELTTMILELRALKYRAEKLTESVEQMDLIYDINCLLSGLRKAKEDKMYKRYSTS